MVQPQVDHRLASSPLDFLTMRLGLHWQIAGGSHIELNALFEREATSKWEEKSMEALDLTAGSSFISNPQFLRFETIN